MVDAGLLEHPAALRVAEIALEPYIEPLSVKGGGFLIPSPELQLKEALAQGAPDLFCLGPVFRAGEEGPRHREQFHLLEWYRRDGTLREAQLEVEGLFQRVCVALGGQGSGGDTWSVREFDELFEFLVGRSLPGEDDAEGLRDTCRYLAESGAPVSLPPDLGLGGRELRDWCLLFSLWSDRFLEPWLRQGPPAGLHLQGFPAPLAALAELEFVEGGRRAARFESYWGDCELANAYRELRDPAEQRARFRAVAELRAQDGLPPLVMPERFLRSLEHPGLPACVGVAMGVERCLQAAGGYRNLDEVCPRVVPSGPESA